jgi:L-fuconolactonase
VIIDAHQHVWDLERAAYDWLGPELAPIDRTFSFEESRDALRRAGVTASVLVQAADNDEDTELMLETAARCPEVVGVVAYVPLADPDRAKERLAELRRSPLVVGVRNLIHDLPDADWLLRPDVDRGLSVIERAGVAFDLVSVLPRHLEHATTIAKRHPSLRIVIDHLSKPPIGGEDREPWWTLIEEAAANPLVYGKISGLYGTVGGPAAWTTDAIRPFFDRALEVFGPDRLMYGGDWPVSITAGGYDRVWGGLSPLIDELSPDEREAILATTAYAFYRLDDKLLAAASAAASGPAKP